MAVTQSPQKSAEHNDTYFYKEDMNRERFKQQLIEIIIQQLTKQLKQAESAANEAHAAAIDDQSVAETQYDTLAIEASYLAEGQSRRVQEYQVAIKAYQTMHCEVFDSNSIISVSALVQLAQDQAKKHWFFIGPAAGGFRCKIQEQNITVITPQSPLAQAIIGKEIDDDIKIQLGNKILSDYIFELI